MNRLTLFTLLFISILGCKQGVVKVSDLDKINTSDIVLPKNIVLEGYYSGYLLPILYANENEVALLKRFILNKRKAVQIYAPYVNMDKCEGKMIRVWGVFDIKKEYNSKQIVLTDIKKIRVINNDNSLDLSGCAISK